MSYASDGSRTEPDKGFVHPDAKIPKASFRPPLLVSTDREKEFLLAHLQPEPFQELQIMFQTGDVELLLRSLGLVRKQEAPCVGRIPHPLGNPGQKGNEGGLKGPLQENRPLEPACSQVSRKPKHSRYALMNPLPVILDDLVDVGVVCQDRDDPRLGNNRDRCVRERPANAPKRSRGDDDVTNPVL